jgi:hypothetical protein
VADIVVAIVAGLIVLVISGLAQLMYSKRRWIYSFGRRRFAWLTRQRRRRRRLDHWQLWLRRHWLMHGPLPWELWEALGRPTAYNPPVYEAFWHTVLDEDQS